MRVSVVVLVVTAVVVLTQYITRVVVEAEVVDVETAVVDVVEAAAAVGSKKLLMWLLHQEMSIQETLL